MCAICLKTKLKGVVNNDTLPKWGVLEFTVTTAMAFNYRNFQDSKVIALDGGHFKATVDGVVVGTYLNEVSVPANKWTIIEFSGTMPYRAQITEKYSLDSFEPQNACTVDVTQFEYCTQMRRVDGTLSNIDNGDISSFAKCVSLESFGFAGSNIKGSLDSLGALTNLTNLNLTYTQVEGNLSNIARFVNLTTLAINEPYITGNISSLGALIKLSGIVYLGPNCEGTIESMANGMIAAGRTSGTLNVDCYSDKVTYNGNGVSSVTITFSGGSYNVVVNS